MSDVHMPTLPREMRCFSCGYDIASLVADRAREGEFVCPECGVSLDESLAAPPGLAVQRTWSTRDYLGFVRAAFLDPLRTADGINPDLSDRASLAMLNCVAAGVLAGALMLVVGAVSAVFSGDFWLVLWSVAIAAGVSVVLGFLFFLIACVLGLLVTGAAAALGASVSFRRAYAAMDIATVWFLPLPWVVVLSHWLPATSIWSSVPRWVVVGASLSPLAVAFVVGVAVHLRWKSDASKPLPGSNLP